MSNHPVAIILCTTMILLSGCKEKVINDVTGLNPIPVSDIKKPISEAEIIQSIADARARGIRISMAGARHSQGGQTAFRDGLILDMRSFNKILDINPQERTIRVQAGATWEQIQNRISPLGLSVGVQQASNIFTVGGSLSVNIHGWDPRYRQFIDTVDSFRLINAQGKLLNVSRHENPELFRWVIGGYGLFGVVTDVTLQLTENHKLVKEVMEIPLQDYLDYHAQVAKDTTVELHYARPSIDPATLFDTVLAISFRAQSDEALIEEHLPDEKNKARNYGVFQISRYLRIPGVFDLGKPIRWWIQKRLIDVPGVTVETSRNRAMRPEIQFTLIPSGFFHTDILQEYFVPKERLLEFMDGVKGIVRTNNINLLSVTIRPIHQDTESAMPYARFNGFAVVLYINLLTAPGDFFSRNWGEIRAKAWTKELINLAYRLGGTFYLPYQRYANRDQVHIVYPEFKDLGIAKAKYDPDNLFWNQFYETYR